MPAASETPEQRCDVWWARPASARLHLLGLVSVDERLRYARLRQQADRDRFLVAHSLLRILLARRLGVAPAAIVLTTAAGKPRLPGADRAHEFSLSHSGHRVVVAITAGAPVGVDVERVSIDRDLEALIQRALSPRERGTMARLAGRERRDAFYRYWVRKEAVVKMTGHGLRMRPELITVSGPREPPALQRWAADDAPTALRMYDLHPGDGHVASLAVFGTARVAVEEHDATPLL